MLLRFIHEIYKSFDESHESRAFFDISKVFAKVWREGLLHKLKGNGISGNLLNIISKKAKSCSK